MKKIPKHLLDEDGRIIPSAEALDSVQHLNTTDAEKWRLAQAQTLIDHGLVDPDDIPPRDRLKLRLIKGGGKGSR